MDVLSFVSNDPLGSLKTAGGYGSLSRNASGVNLPTQSEWMSSVGSFSPDWMNLTGQYLTYFNGCKAAESIWNSNKATWASYNTALSTWQTAFNNAGCNPIAPPPTPPVLQVLSTENNPCAVKANEFATQANADMNANYAPLKSNYDQTVARCTAIGAQKPTTPTVPNNPGVFVPNPSLTGYGVYGTPSGADGMPQPPFENANGGNGYRNAVVKMKGGKLNATGDCPVNEELDSSTGACVCKAGYHADSSGNCVQDSAKANWITVLMLTGVTLLAYKLFIVK
jgi:hypothetical protein